MFKALKTTQDNLYWTDWDTEGVHTANKFTGRDHDMLVHGMFGTFITFL